MAASVCSVWRSAKLANVSKRIQIVQMQSRYHGILSRCTSVYSTSFPSPIASLSTNLHLKLCSFSTSTQRHLNICTCIGTNHHQLWQRRSQMAVGGQSSHRGYSSDSGDGKDPRLEELKGVVMYIPNPITWLKFQWLMLKLRKKYDPGFSMTEFLLGAKQAICHVSHLLSLENYDHLENVVSHQVAVWLKGHISMCSTNEKESLSLSPAEIVVMKARGGKLVEHEGEAILYIDTVCFALKRDMQNMKPLLIDIGFRFMRNYSTKPPSDWIIGGVSHFRFQTLT